MGDCSCDCVCWFLHSRLRQSSSPFLPRRSILFVYTSLLIVLDNDLQLITPFVNRLSAKVPPHLNMVWRKLHRSLFYFFKLTVVLIKGFVFGCYELTVFLTSPIFGKYVRVPLFCQPFFLSYFKIIWNSYLYIFVYSKIPYLIPKFLLNGGLFVTGFCSILFGYIFSLIDIFTLKFKLYAAFVFSVLDHINDTSTFIGLSFAVRIVEALGNAAFLTAAFAIIAAEFPDSIATTFVSSKQCLVCFILL